MTHKVFTTFTALSLCSIAFGQYFNEGMTDLQNNNLKGPVVQVIEKRYGIKEAFGEWEKGDMIHSDLMIFCDTGNYLIKAHTKTEYVDGVGRGSVIDGYDTYTYDAEGKIESIEEVRTSNYLYNVLDDLVSDYVPLFQGGGTRTREYEYNDIGTIKAITTMNNDWRHATSSIYEKQIYKHNADGYEIWFYNRSGRRISDKVYSLNNEKRIIQQGQDGHYITNFYDENGKLVASANALRAANGELKGETFYAYNDNGDLLAYANSIDAVKSIQGLEALSPFIEDRLKQSITAFYDYEYDSYGNWVVQKGYTIRRDELVVFGWWEREITYSTDGFNGSTLANRIFDAISLGKEREREQQEEEERKRQEQEEWDARPIYSSLPEAFGPWLVSQLTYPEESSALGSILKARGSDLRIRVSLSISAEGKITIRDSEWNLRNEKVYLVGGKKESDQAEIEAKEYVESFQRIMTNAPIGKKGKEGSRGFVTIVLRDGTIKEGY